ncbi:MAG TPA: S-layer glycoprotein N-glycosyltransferase AglJ [Natrialbaceae archaeon]|nr:S-layer glycoprotein N-glycosyltransferase AglJ [Natrialbaceae archaeon]
MDDRDDVCVLVPTYNEAETIGDVVRGFREEGFDRVLVIDGRSTDDTRQLAEAAGAEVVVQSGTGRGSGKGQAVREGLELVEKPYVLLVDGDGTYRPEDADSMIEPLLDGECEHVIGDRFADMRPGAMSRLNRSGNRLINWGFRRIHGQDFGDILSGYRAFTLESTGKMPLTAQGFGIETEMAVECVKQGIETCVVPITYEPRPDESETNLRPFRDGGIILLTLYRMAKTSNPLFYFGSVGVLLLLLGAVLGTYVGVEWVTTRTSHEVLAFVAGFFVLLGIQLGIFGLLSDMVVSLHQEQMRRLDRLDEAITEDD